MDLKNSKTAQNMKNSLMGESMARNKYTFYAMKAKQDGEQEIADLFEKMAQNEAMHAKIWFQYLNGGLGDSKNNLKDAASGEYEEWTSMYPKFAAEAREEGFTEIADMFERVAEIEKDHEQRFLKLYAKVMGAGASVQAEHTDSASSTQVPAHRCMFCGATYEKRPDVCRVCGAIGSFESCTIQK